MEAGLLWVRRWPGRLQGWGKPASCSSHLLPLLSPPPPRGLDWLDLSHHEVSFQEKDNGLPHHWVCFLLLTPVLVLSSPLGGHRSWHQYFAPWPCILVIGNWSCFHAHFLQFLQDLCLWNISIRFWNVLVTLTLVFTPSMASSYSVTNSESPPGFLKAILVYLSRFLSLTHTDTPSSLLANGKKWTIIVWVINLTFFFFASYF